jgi:uncharacterized protein (TIGR02271 family)
MTSMTGQQYQRTITAFFDKEDEANRAISRLTSAGIPRSNISMVAGRAQSVPARKDEELGFWESLKDFFMPEEDRATYAEGLRRGGYLVGVRTDSAHYEKAIDILDDEGTIDLDQRSAAWRNEGWTGYTGREAEMGLSGPNSTSKTRAPSAQTTSARTAGREEVIPVAEEQVRIGKRDVSHGRVRVRSYVVETPVQEQVALREENVRVERRPVDRPSTGNEGLFKERVIEAEERAQEAVVSKDARVKEEIAVKKDATSRTETVSDKVRRTEVEVEDERGKVTRSGERKTR